MFQKFFIIIYEIFLQTGPQVSVKVPRDLWQCRLTFVTDAKYAEDRCHEALYDAQVLVPVVTR